MTEALDTPFPPELVKRNPQGFDYVPAAEVVARMNRVLGRSGWKVEIVETRAFGAVDTNAGPMPLHVTAHVRVHIKDGEEWTFKDGMGGQDVAYFRDRERGPVNLGDSFKGACSDAMKKALTHDGVALELARKDEALRYEAQLQAEAQWATKDQVDRLLERVKNLPPYGKNAVKAEMGSMGYEGFTHGPITAEHAAALAAFIAEIEGALSGGGQDEVPRIAAESRPAPSSNSSGGEIEPHPGRLSAAGPSDDNRELFEPPEARDPSENIAAARERLGAA